jgi:biopolymer transport protein ExbD
MAKRKKREVQEAEVPISSMIDIVFLLIIFFVVTAAIDKEIQDEKIELAKAPHGKPLTKKDPRSVTINVRSDSEDGSFFTIGMQIMSPSQISQQLVTAANKWGKDIPIIIRGDRDTQHEHIKEVMEAVTRTRLYKIKFNAEISGKKD